MKNSLINNIWEIVIFILSALLLVLILICISCDDPRIPNACYVGGDYEINGFNIKKITMDGHEYWYYSDGYRFALAHSGNCPCWKRRDAKIVNEVVKQLKER